MTTETQAWEVIPLNAPNKAVRLQTTGPYEVFATLISVCSETQYGALANALLHRRDHNFYETGLSFDEERGSQELVDVFDSFTSETLERSTLLQMLSTIIEETLSIRESESATPQKFELCQMLHAALRTLKAKQEAPE